MSSIPPQSAPQSNSRIWVIIVIIVILLITAFMLYYRGAIQENNMWQLPAVSVPRDATAALRAQGAADDVASIEKDLNATNLNNLTNEASAISQELSAPAVK